MGQHALNRVNLVDNVEVTLFIDSLVESASKLLHRVDQDCRSLTVHVETFSKCLALTLNHTLAGQDHVVKNLMMEDIDFTCCLVVLLKYVLVSFVHLFVQILLHQVLESLDFVALHALQLLSLEMILSGGELPLSFNIFHLTHDFPAECIIELSKKGLHPDLVERQWILGYQDHQGSFHYLRPDELLIEDVSFFEDLTVQVETVDVLLLTRV